MAGQVAVAAVLLLGAAVLGRSFIALISADRGYDPSHVLTARLPLPDATYTPVRRSAALERVIDRVKRVPGVTAAAVSTGLPLVPGETLASFPMRSPRDGGTVHIHTSIRHVSPGYFEALRLRIRDGRGFSDSDNATAPAVILVNRVFARLYLGQSPVGSRVPAGYKHGETEAEVVGIVDDVTNGAITDPVAPELYRCTLQLSDGFDDDVPSLIVRTAGDPLGLVRVLRSIIGNEDASVALESVMTMDDRLGTSLAKPRLYALLLGAFAVFALTIAGVGLFGVLSRIVSLRTREIGVRTALGAAPADVVRLVLTQALAVTIGGVAVGLAVSAAVGRYVSKLLYGVTPYDPVSYSVVSTVLILVVIVACIVPARRAARIEPVRVLR
jgi:putative ABC transport system permease protein